MMIVRFLLVALLVFIAVTIVAFQYLQWWQALIVMLATIVALAYGMKLVIRSFIGNIGKALMQGFELKGKVLRGATAEVHSVEAAPEPPPRIVDQDEADDDGDEAEADDDEDEDEADDEDESERRDLAYYRIDVTIRPQRPEGPMTHWDLSDLCVVDHTARPISLTPGSDDDDDTDAGEGFHFDDVQVYEDGKLHADEQGKYEGEQRVNLLVGVPRELRELKFRYYTEDFGRVVLPPPFPREPGDPRDAQPLLA